MLATALIASNRVKGYLAVAADRGALQPDRSPRSPSTSPTAGTATERSAPPSSRSSPKLWILLGALHFRSPGVVDRAEARRILRILVATVAMVPPLLLLSGAAARRAGRRRGGRLRPSRRWRSATSRSGELRDVLGVRVPVKVRPRAARVADGDAMPARDEMRTSRSIRARRSIPVRERRVRVARSGPQARLSWHHRAPRLG